ncbi:MAG: hypothetical protein JW996_00340, partial [Candidatus Cloacimonetes bacterium]|nr:hypothetical protein [Candidatus Cloacimonadota bacterium]
DDELIQKMEELQSEIDKNGLSEDLQNSKKNLEQNNPSAAQQNQCDAASKMASMTGKLDEMMQMMSSGSMMEMGDMLEKTISRLLLFSRDHEKSTAEYFGDPFEILPAQIAIFEGLNLSLRELYSIPMIALVIGPKFIYDANYTNSVYRELFQHINDAGSHKVKPLLDDAQKGLNIMIFDLLQAKNNMQSGGGGGMQSLMKALQQMGQQQMLISMMTQQMFMQMGQDGKLDRDMMAQAQRLARDEERLAENLKRLLQNDPDAQKQTSTLNKIIEDLESISRNLKRGNINQDLIDQQERILSRLLDAQKSIHKREFSKKRKAEQSEIDIWELPEDIKLRFDKLRQKALLKEDYKKYSKEYQALIKEYLKILNEKASIGNPEN